MMVVLAETGPLWSIIEAVGQILLAMQQIVTAIGSVVFTSPVLPLLCWAGFWLFAVDWTRLRQIMLGGGWMGVLLIGVVMVIVPVEGPSPPKSSLSSTLNWLLLLSSATV